MNTMNAMSQYYKKFWQTISREPPLTVEENKRAESLFQQTQSIMKDVPAPLCANIKIVNDENPSVVEKLDRLVNKEGFRSIYDSWPKFQYGGEPCDDKLWTMRVCRR